MLLTSPIIGALDFLFWRGGLFAVEGGNARFAITNLFMTAMVCCLVGALSSMREIVKEADIYKRERMVVLRILPYVLSKVWIAVLVALYSSLVFLLFMEMAGGWPPLESVTAVYFTMALSVLGGALMGLVISALSPNPNVTPLLILLVLVPQLLFGGIIPSDQVGKAGNIIGYTTTTKWTFESLVRISGIGDCVISDPCWQLSEAKRGTLTEVDKDDKCKCMGPSIFKRCDFPGIRNFYTKEIDQPEPLKPTKLAEPPPKPEDPPPRPEDTEDFNYWTKQNKWFKELDKFMEELDQYQEEMNAYNEKMNQYQSDVESWQNKYQDWKEKRSKAIGEAEGTIKAVYDDYGQAFRANVKSHWSVLSLITLILFCMVLGVLRLKDKA